MPHDHSSHQGSPPPSGARALTKWIFWGFVLVALYFLFTEHRAHVVPYLPFALLLACPLMHFFHHGGHGGHGDDEEDTGQRKADRDTHQH